MCIHSMMHAELFSRHRFTAVLLSQLLMSSFQSPHRIFNAVISSFCGFLPSDAQRFVDEEQDVTGINKFHTAIEPFDFSEILDSMSLVPVLTVLT